MQLTRKQFLGQIAGSSVLMAAAGVVGTAATRVRDQIRYGVALVDFTGSYAPASMVQACLAAAASTGTQGVEILADRHVFAYPHPPSEWIHSWHSWMVGYGIRPSCYNGPAHVANGAPELVDHLIRDLVLARALGFTVVRPDLSYLPILQWGDVTQRVLPFAHKHDLSIVLQPESADGASLDRCAEFVARDDSGCLGLVVERSEWKHVARVLGSLARVHHMRDILVSSYVFSRERHCWEFGNEHGCDIGADESRSHELLSARYSGFVSLLYDGPRGIYPVSGNLARAYEGGNTPLSLG